MVKLLLIQIRDYAIFSRFCLKEFVYSSYCFSNLSIGGEFLRPGVEGSPLTAELDDMPELVLSHHVNIFTIQYAALDMTGNENITYAYMLEGLDNTWKYVGGQRSVTYTNLKKGKYRLKIRSTNADGVWVENTRILPITILPSFWETGWAYFCIF